MYSKIGKAEWGKGRKGSSEYVVEDGRGDPTTAVGVDHAFWRPRGSPQQRAYAYVTRCVWCAHVCHDAGLVQGRTLLP